jgi:hypothetical protein
VKDSALINAMHDNLNISKLQARRLIDRGAVHIEGDTARVGRRSFKLPPPSLNEVPDEQLRAFVTSLRAVRDVKLTLDQGTMKRVRAHMDRVEREQPGVGYAAGESDTDSLRVALGSLLDRALAESEADEGLVYEFLSGHLKVRPSVRLRRRVRQAWKTLRRGW